MLVDADLEYAVSNKSRSRNWIGFNRDLTFVGYRLVTPLFAALNYSSILHLNTNFAKMALMALCQGSDYPDAGHRSKVYVC